MFSILPAHEVNQRNHEHLCASTPTWRRGCADALYRATKRLTTTQMLLLCPSGANANTNAHPHSHSHALGLGLNHTQSVHGGFYCIHTIQTTFSIHPTVGMQMSDMLNLEALVTHFHTTCLYDVLQNCCTAAEQLLIWLHDILSAWIQGQLTATWTTVLGDELPTVYLCRWYDEPCSHTLVVVRLCRIVFR